MKNCCYYLVLILFFASCQDAQELRKKTDSTIEVVDGRLKFSDDKHFLETVVSLQQGNTDVVDGRVLGLDYKSFLSTLENPSLISENFQLLDNFEFRVLLNYSKEVQIGEKIYAISNDETKIFNLNLELIETTKNEVSYYDRESRSFESKNLANGKAFGVYYTESFGYEIDGSTQHGVKYQYLRVNAGLYLFYYYETTYYTPLFSAVGQTVVEYFQREISDCEISSCMIQPDNPYGGTTYNVSKVRYPCGANSRSYELAHGAFLRAAYWVKPYNKNSRYVVHYDDLDIP